MESPLKGAGRAVLYLLWFGLNLPFQALCVWLRLPFRRTLPRLFHRVSCRALGLRIVQVGSIRSDRPTLFVANHSSYLDIEVLGALIDGSFVAKAEVARWPLFGLMAKLQETVFVNRSARREIERQSRVLESRLEAGDNLILFPEGTSSDGNRTLPFKSALFAVAESRSWTEPLVIQPISVTAVALDGIPLGRTLRHLYAWYGDMNLIPHLWSMLQAGDVTVEVEFHEPVTLALFGSRKALAEHCRKVIGEGVSRAVAGRRFASLPEAASDEVDEHPGRTAVA